MQETQNSIEIYEGGWFLPSSPDIKLSGMFTIKGGKLFELIIHDTIHLSGYDIRNIIAEVLLQRYELLTHHQVITHATTNLNANELEELYGNRVRSRLRKMFNLISFPSGAKDKRK